MIMADTTRYPLPLEGIVVVAIEQAVAGPLATRHLADLGARVIKIERTDGGDFARSYDTAVRGLASHFVWLNRAKESVALNLKDADACSVLRTLVADADVFLQNLAPGAAGRLGFDADTLTTRHPRLIVCDISGYGSSGPYRDKRAYDLLVQCEAALVAVTGTPEQPAKTGVPNADIATGLYAYGAVLGALFQRERTGRGRAIEVTMLDAVAEWMGHPIYTAMFTGVAPPRAGLSHPTIAPYDSYPTRDGAVVIGIQNDREWARLAAQVLQRPGLAVDPGFATNVARVQNRRRVDAAVAEAVSGLSTDEAIERLDEAGIASARLNTVHDLIEHPQLSARNRWREIDSPVGPVPALLPAATYAGQEARMGSVPDLGQHTASVLLGAGFEQEYVATLAARGAIRLGSTP